MKKHISKYEKAYNSLIACIQAICLGVYFNKFGSVLGDDSSIWDTIILLNTWNFIMVFVVLLLCLQIRINIISRKFYKYSKELIVNKILETACKTLIHPEMEKHIRAIVTICDYKKQTRKTVYSYNIDADPERKAEFDLYFGITGEAIELKVPIAKSLPKGHTNTYSDKNKLVVAESLKCVLAAPIRSPSNDLVIGVLAFDSFEGINIMKFKTKTSKEIAQSWADILSYIIN